MIVLGEGGAADGAEGGAMDDLTQIRSGSPGEELVSAARAIAFLRGELDRVGAESAAAQLYLAFIESLERVYRLPRRRDARQVS
jgi:hypothetical protein